MSITKKIKTSVIKDKNNHLTLYNCLSNYSVLSDFNYLFLFKNKKNYELNCLNLSSLSIPEFVDYIITDIIEEENDLIELVIVNDSNNDETYELDKVNRVFYLIDSGGIVNV